VETVGAARRTTWAEIVLRMLLLKHMRGWSFEDAAREVRASLVYSEFTGTSGGKVPDDETMGRLSCQPRPADKQPECSCCGC